MLLSYFCDNEQKLASKCCVSSELKYEVALVIGYSSVHNCFEHSSHSSPPVPPGLPLVTVRPLGNGLVVSCTPSANGDPPTSYDITVEPNGTHHYSFQWNS